MAQEKYPVPEMEPGEEIRILKERLERLEAEIGKEAVSFGEKEKAAKREIKNYLQELQRTPSFAPPIVSRDERGEIEKLEPSQQVGALISLVFERGLEKAVSVAKSLDNPAILDEFHDTLVDRYYEELIKEKIIK